MRLPILTKNKCIIIFIKSFAEKVGFMFHNIYSIFKKEVGFRSILFKIWKDKKGKIETIIFLTVSLVGFALLGLVVFKIPVISDKNLRLIYIIFIQILIYLGIFLYSFKTIAGFISKKYGSYFKKYFAELNILRDILKKYELTTEKLIHEIVNEGENFIQEKTINTNFINSSFFSSFILLIITSAIGILSNNLTEKTLNLAGLIVLIVTVILLLFYTIASLNNLQYEGMKDMVIELRYIEANGIDKKFNEKTL
jgi:uncharacterized membrane protein YqjE